MRKNRTKLEIKELYEAGPPRCRCGCNEETKWNEGRKKWGEYKKGHSTPKIVKREEDRPFCACKCGEKTEWNVARRRWNRFAYNHQRSVRHKIPDQL